jgi:hypothetical protein
MIESDVASSISKVSQVINASVIADFKIIGKAKKDKLLVQYLHVHAQTLVIVRFK